jgi:zinc/manganese transport system substrate-binding protein
LGWGWICIAVLGGGPAAAAPDLVAAESAYADIARQVAGPDATVSAILTNPAADPHDFEPTPSVARRVADAGIAVLNGAGYDPWMDRLLPAGAQPIVVATLLGRHAGDNPHLWYDPLAAPALARAVRAALTRADPRHGAAYAARADALLADLARLGARIGVLRARYAGTRVTATEPVFGLMEAALGLADRHGRFQLAVMNGTEPRAGDLASLQDDLRAGRVRALVTDTQATSPATERLRAIARQAGIPCVPITETLPPGRTYQAWVGGELSALEAALAAPR